MYFQVLIILVLNVNFIITSVFTDETCHSYAGGSVYPLGSDPQQTEHKLQWTKAVSKY